MNPYIHSLIDEKNYNIAPENTIHIHNFLDSSKLTIGDNRHRVFFHHSYMPYISHRIFGHTITNKNKQEVSIKDIVEQSHILADFKKKFIPTLSDYFKDFHLKGDEFELLKEVKMKTYRSLTPEQIQFLQFPYEATGKTYSLLLTHNSFWLYYVMPLMFKDYKLKQKELSFTSLDIVDRIDFKMWINNGITKLKR